MVKTRQLNLYLSMLTTCTVVAALALGSVSSASYAPAPAAVTTAPITAPSYPCTNPDAALTGRDVVSSGVVHSGRVAGSTASEIASKINARAFESAGGATKPCADFSHAELDAIVSEVRVQFHRFRSTYSAARAGSSLSCSHRLQRITRSRARAHHMSPAPFRLDVVPLLAHAGCQVRCSSWRWAPAALRVAF